MRRPGCENTHNLGVQMRRTFNRFFNQYKSLVEPNYPEMKFSREDLLWGFNTLVACGWGSGNDGTGDKMMVPFSELPVHRRESAQKVLPSPPPCPLIRWLFLRGPIFVFLRFSSYHTVLVTPPRRLPTVASSQPLRSTRLAKSSPLTTACSTTLCWLSTVHFPRPFLPLFLLLRLLLSRPSRHFRSCLISGIPTPDCRGLRR